MHPIVERLRRWLQSPDLLIECRHCGTTLDTTVEPCPACGSSETSHYDLSQ